METHNLFDVEEVTHNGGFEALLHYPRNPRRLLRRLIRGCLHEVWTEEIAGRVAVGEIGW